MFSCSFRSIHNLGLAIKAQQFCIKLCVKLQFPFKGLYLEVVCFTKIPCIILIYFLFLSGSNKLHGVLMLFNSKYQKLYNCMLHDVGFAYAQNQTSLLASSPTKKRKRKKKKEESDKQKQDSLIGQIIGHICV